MVLDTDAMIVGAGVPPALQSRSSM